MSLPTVDVRDVAQAHIQACFSASVASRNHRLLLSSRSLWFKEMLKTLKEHERDIFGDDNKRKINTRTSWSLTLKIASLFYQDVKYLLPFLNVPIEIDGSQAALELGLSYRDVRESLIETAQAIESFKVKA